MAYYKCGTIHPTQNSNVVVDTASGTIANFETPLAMPLLDAQIDVNAVQDLHGQSGAYPAGGSAQIWDEDWELGSIDNSTGLNTNDNNNIRCKNYISVSPSTAYYFKVATSTYIRIYWYDENNTFISSETAYSGVKTSPNNAKFLRLRTTENYGNTYKNDISVNYPSTDTAYHPYSNICPIDGWDEISVYKLGGNFFDKDTLSETGKLINGSGNEVSYADWNISDFIPVIEGASYYFYGIATHPNTNQDNFELFDENKNKVGFANVKTNEQPYTIPSGVAYIKCCVKNQDLDTAQFGVYVNDSFVPYNPVIEETVIQLGNTYYGGRFIQDKDGKRKFEVTHGYAHYDLSQIPPNDTSGGWDSWLIYRAERAEANPSSSVGKLCNCCPEYSYAGSQINRPHYYISSGAFVMYLPENTYRNGYLEYTFPLETPFVVDLPDGTPFKSLPGVNNVFADTGDTAVKFRKIGE